MALFENWKAIKGFEGIYEVSDLGIVKSLERYVRRSRCGMMFVRERMLRAAVNGRGYYQVTLHRDGHIWKKGVSRLVAEAFLPSYSEDLQVDHINGNKLWSVSSNLRMATNAQNGRAYQRKPKGCSSRFRGVYWAKQLSKWKAGIKFEGKLIYIGIFHDEADAARAYNAKALQLGFNKEALNQI